MSVLVILQARVSSRRLPEKVLQPILGKPLLLHQWERVQQAKRIDTSLIATSTDPSDDAIETLCRSHQIPCFRGDLNDVLERFVQAAQTHQPTHIVRLTGDCPLIDPDIIDTVIAAHLANNNDITTNALPPSYPDGLDVEVIRYSALLSAHEKASLPSQREHVTPYLYAHPEQYQIGHVQNTEDLSHLRWTVDEPDDLLLVQTIYETLYPQSPHFRMADVLGFLHQHPQLQTLNTHHQRNAGYETSLANDPCPR